MKRIAAISTFLKDTPDPPKVGELAEFLKSCTDEEKEQFAQQAAKLLGTTLDEE